VSVFFFLSVKDITGTAKCQSGVKNDRDWKLYLQLLLRRGMILFSDLKNEYRFGKTLEFTRYGRLTFFTNLLPFFFAEETI